MSSYQSTYPTAKLSSYTPNSTVDFKLSFQDFKIARNSIRLECDVIWKKATNVVTSDNVKQDNIQYDGYVGCHGLIQSVNTSTDQGLLDDNQEYARYVKMSTMVNVDKTELSTRSNYISEGRVHNDRLSKYLLYNNPGNQNRMSCSFKPIIAFNKTNRDINFYEAPNPKLSFRLASNNQFFYGSTTGYTYTLENLRLTYYIEPADPKGDEALVYSIVHSVKQTVESTNSNISANVPMVATSVSIVFNQEARLNTYANNHLECLYPPDVESVQLSWNDQNNKYISYKLEHEQEILYNFVQSVGNNEINLNGIRLSELKKGKNYGIGLKFSPTDLSNQTFAMNLRSGVSQANYAAFMFFRGVLEAK